MCRSTLFEIAIVVLLSTCFLPIVYASGRVGDINKFFEAYNVKAYNKCGFHIIAHYFGLPDADMSIKKLLQDRPINDTSIVSTSGRFRIHFDTSGINQPFLYDSLGQRMLQSTYAFVDSVAEICDHVYQIEVDSLGFPPPPSDSGAGGGNEYDIYIQGLPTGEYGYTDWDDTQPIINRTNSTYAAWTVIRNEFQSTYTQGIPAIEVTIAHEFHHGIQIGNYGLWQNDLYFYELTSTWMEQVVYPEVKDYYQYLPNFFNNVDQPFNLYDIYSYAGYERCVFGIYVQNEYDIQVMKSIWQNMAHEPSVPAIEDAFKAIHADPSYVFQLFAQWNYFTGYRSASVGTYNVVTYPLAIDYPLVKISGFGSLSGSGVDFSATALSLTEHFYQIDNGPDTMGIEVVNNNFTAAANYDTTDFLFSVGISSNGESNCVKPLTGGYCLSFAPADFSDWGVVPFISGGEIATKNDVVFPQPFNPSLQELRIPYPFSVVSGASLSILGISGNLVNKLDGDQALVFYLRGRYFLWDGKGKDGKIVSSGVYIYVLTDGSRSVVGKIAVVRN